MKCEVCNETELEGFTASALSETPDDEVTLISLKETARRNYIVCDGCSKAVCRNCCENSRSGYCDSCIAKYNLNDPSKEFGLISEL